jgi:hypothetical protein
MAQGFKPIACLEVENELEEVEYPHVSEEYDHRSDE